MSSFSSLVSMSIGTSCGCAGLLVAADKHQVEALPETVDQPESGGAHEIQVLVQRLEVVAAQARALLVRPGAWRSTARGAIDLAQLILGRSGAIEVEES